MCVAQQCFETPRPTTTGRSPNMARLAALCILAAAACCLLRSLTFVSAPAARSDALTAATGAAVLASIPAGADAFVYKGIMGCN